MLARELGVPFEILHCVADDASSRERLQRRERLGADPSDATVAVWEVQKQHVEPLTVSERDVATRCTADVAQIAAIAARWRAGAPAPLAA
jgi:predicted kinase